MIEILLYILTLIHYFSKKYNKSKYDYVSFFMTWALSFGQVSYSIYINELSIWL